MTTFSFFPRVRQQTRGFPGIKHHGCFRYHDVIRTSQEVGVAFFSSVVRNAPGCSRAAINIHVLASSSTRLYSSAVASQPPKASARGSVGAYMGTCSVARARRHVSLHRHMCSLPRFVITASNPTFHTRHSFR